MEKAKYVIDPKAALPGRIYQKDRPWSCAYCYWWGKAGCTKSDCWYLEPVKPEKPKSDVSKTVRIVLTGSICRVSDIVSQKSIGN